MAIAIPLNGCCCGCRSQLRVLVPGDGTCRPLYWTITGYTAGSILNCLTPAIIGATGTVQCGVSVPAIYSGCGVPLQWLQADFDVTARDPLDPGAGTFAAKALIGIDVTCCEVSGVDCFCIGVAICVVKLDGTYLCSHTGSAYYCGDLPIDVEFAGDPHSFGEQLSWHITS